MEPNNKRELQKAAAELGDKTYEPEHYTSQSEMEQGLAITHEQVSDYYLVGARYEENEGMQVERIPRVDRKGSPKDQENA